MPRHLAQSLVLNKTHKNAIGVVGSYFWIDFFRSLIKLKDLPPKKMLNVNNRNIFYGENVEGAFVGEEEAVKRQLAIVDTIFSIPISDSASLVKKTEAKESDQLSSIQSYQGHRLHYAKEIGYENLSKDNAEEVKVGSELCMAEKLAFSDEIEIRMHI